eukprot:4488218-Lingulodinium_polyedra.AAC.1
MFIRWCWHGSGWDTVKRVPFAVASSTGVLTCSLLPRFSRSVILTWPDTGGESAPFAYLLVHGRNVALRAHALDGS